MIRIRMDIATICEQGQYQGQMNDSANLQTHSSKAVLQTKKNPRNISKIDFPYFVFRSTFLCSIENTLWILTIAITMRSEYFSFRAKNCLLIPKQMLQDHIV